MDRYNAICGCGCESEDQVGPCSLKLLLLLESHDNKIQVIAIDSEF